MKFVKKSAPSIAGMKLVLSSDRTQYTVRAALGIAEESDALALVVSEENGRISIAYEGELHYNLTLDEFRMTLVEELKPKTEVFYGSDASESEGDVHE